MSDWPRPAGVRADPVMRALAALRPLRGEAARRAHGRARRRPERDKGRSLTKRRQPRATCRLRRLTRLVAALRIGASCTRGACCAEAAANIPARAARRPIAATRRDAAGQGSAMHMPTRSSPVSTIHAFDASLRKRRSISSPTSGSADGSGYDAALSRAV